MLIHDHYVKEIHPLFVNQREYILSRRRLRECIDDAAMESVCPRFDGLGESERERKRRERKRSGSERGEGEREREIEERERERERERGGREI
jgi:hypothetical protein